MLEDHAIEKSTAGRSGFSTTQTRSFAYSGNNLYAYVAGDPINHTDPSGQDWCSIDAESYDGCDAVGPDQNGVCYILTGLGADMALLGGQGCGEVVWGDPGTFGGSGPCGGVLAFAGSGCGAPGPGPVGQPQQQQVIRSIALYERGVPFPGSPANHTYLVLTETSASGSATEILEAGPTNRHNPFTHPHTSWGNLKGLTEPPAAALKDT